MQYRRAKNVAWRRIGGQTVVLNLDRRRMLALNDSGTAVWETLVPEAGRTFADATQIGSDGSPSASELDEFLADLEQEGVVERSEGVSPDLVAGAASRATGSRPAVAWREELHRFGGSCAMLPAQGDFCNSRPTSS